jgi:hypothetical protein
MHISPWLIRRSSQIVAAEAATHMFNFAMLQKVCGIRRLAGKAFGIKAAIILLSCRRDAGEFNWGMTRCHLL